MLSLVYQRPWLYPKQEAAFFNPSRFSYVEASTKSGKTVGCIAWITELALRGKKDQNFWWVAPVTAQAMIAYRRMKSGLARNAYEAREQERKITLRGGQHIWFKGSDLPDGLYGEDVFGAVIDEGSRVKEASYEALYSTLTATKGPLRVIGNVKGRKNWFYRMSRLAEASEFGAGLEYHRITAKDAIEAGIIEDETVRMAQRDLHPDVFKQLYLAEATDDDGNPFGFAAIRKCLIEGLSMKEPVAWGWDLAKSIDYTVGIALDEDGVVCRFVRFQHVPWGDAIRRIRDETGRTPALVDSTGIGDPILEANLQTDYGGNFEGFKFTSPSKQQLMEGLAVAIHQRIVRFPEGPISLELEQFEYEFSRVGVKYSAPEGMFDDCVMALGLAVRKRGDPSSVRTWLKAFS